MSDLEGGLGTPQSGRFEPAFETWLMGDRLCRMLVDSERALIWTNVRGRRLLDQADVLVERSGRVDFADQALAGEFQSFIAAEPPAPSAMFCVRNPDEDGHYVVRVKRLSAAATGTLFGLSVHGDQGSDDDYADFSDAFSLTPTERKIVSQLMNGLTAEQVAQSSGGSIGTVRTHIRSIYAKLNVSSREGLFSKLQPFRL